MSAATTLVILAAGMGSRYGGLKQIDEFGPNGETILDYSIYDAINAGISKVVFVIRESFRKEIEEVFCQKLANKVELVFVAQELDDLPEGYVLPEERERPWGTAHAVWAARNVVAEPFVVINADDYYGIGAYDMVCEFLHSSEYNQQDYAIVAYELVNTLSEHGTVNRGVCETNEFYLSSIHERLKIGIMEDGRIAYSDEVGERVYLSPQTPVSMNFWGFYPDFFDYCEASFRRFLKKHIHEPKSEFYIPILIEELVNSQEKRVRLLTCNAEWFGVTYIEDKPFVQERIQKLVSEGVYPSNLWR